MTRFERLLEGIRTAPDYRKEREEELLSLMLTRGRLAREPETAKLVKKRILELRKEKTEGAEK